MGEEKEEEYKIVYAEISGVFAAPMKGMTGEGRTVHMDSIGFTISWGARNIGFGEFSISKDGFENGKYIGKVEGMSKEFVKAVLNKLVDSMEIRD